jgi:tetratricopeptide (TPR) repeat protein
VLDDLPFEPGHVKAWEQMYAGLVYTINERRIAMITTSRKSLPASVRNLLGPDTSAEIVVPDLDVSEIAQLCLQMGCPRAHTDTQAKITYFHTSGHPQLVHARLLTLSNENWPPPSSDGLLEKPKDVREQQQQARQLLGACSTDETELLYRASVALGPFRREHIIQLGERANLPRPGDLFDRLVGPWIERVVDDYFELSPLLQNAGAEVWPPEKVTGIHSQLADAILKAKVLSTVDGSHALFHALLGDNATALTGLAISLLEKGTEDVQKAFGGAAFWFLVARVDEGSGALYAGDSALSLLLRMAQFRLCVSADPEIAWRVMDAWEREIVSLDHSPPNLLARLLFLVNALLYVQVPMRPGRVLRMFAEFADLRHAMNESLHKDLFETLPLVHIERDGKQMKIMAILFAVNGMRCKNKSDLLEMLNGLAGLDARLRSELMDDTETAIGYAAVYVDSSFRNECQAETPDWSGLLSAMSTAMDFAVEWGAQALGAHAARIAAVVLDEQCSRSDDALDLLDCAEQRFPAHLSTIEEARGTILLHRKQYDEAVEAFERAAGLRKTWQTDTLDIPIFTLRNAGIAAAHIGRWERAAFFFTQASSCASDLNDTVMTAAFMSDAAFAFWEAGDRTAMLDAMMESIATIDAIDMSERDLGRLWVRRGTAHLLSWLHGEATGGLPAHELDAPRAGMCSRPEYNDEILALPDVPFELMLYLLIKLEYILGSAPKARAQYGPRLEDVTTPAVALLMGEMQIHEALSTGSLSCLPTFLDKMVRGYAAARAEAEGEGAVWSESEASISDAQMRRTLVDGGLLESTLLAALLRCGAESGPCGETPLIERWRSCGTAYAWADDLTAYLDAAESLQRSSAAEKCGALRNREASERDRQLAAVCVAREPENVTPRDVLQAHVFLLEKFSRDPWWAGDMEEVVSELISKTWSEIAQSRFQLLTPAVTVPALEAACAELPESYGKASAVLIAAADATGGRLPPALLRRYRELRDAEEAD